MTSAASVFPTSWLVLGLLLLLLLLRFASPPHLTATPRSAGAVFRSTQAGLSAAGSDLLQLLEASLL